MFGPDDFHYVSVPTCARKLHLGPKTTEFFFLCVVWAYAKATSDAISTVVEIPVIVYQACYYCSSNAIENEVIRE